MNSTLDKNKLKGTIFVMLGAICFSVGGVLVKSIPWSPITIQGLRSIFSSIVIGGYMILNHRKFVFNKTVLFGAICNLSMAFCYVAALKATTAANAIILQYTAPIFVILFSWAFYKKKPGKDAILTSAVVFAGIMIFFVQSLSGGGMVGNILALLSGLAYSLVMMMKGFDGADFESSLLLSNLLSFIIAIPSYGTETEYTAEAIVFLILLGSIQVGASYLFLSKGLDYVSPVTASLTSTIEPILNPLLVAIFCGEQIGLMAVVGAVLVIGSATVYNVHQAKCA